MQFKGIIALEGIPCQLYLSLHSKFLASLVPIKEIENVVETVMDDYFSDKLMIGIHLRSHDEFQDWAVVH